MIKCLHELTASCPYCDVCKYANESDHIVCSWCPGVKEGREFLKVNNVIGKVAEELKNQKVLKRGRGRPRKFHVEVPEGKDRKKVMQVEYLKKRYHQDPEFRNKCLQNGKIQYRLKKQKQEVKDVLTKELYTDNQA